MFHPTSLIYSSHNRCDYLHRHWIVERALRHPTNKTIFFLPHSNDDYGQQVFAYDNFRWYFRRFEPYGLRHSTFYWTESLRRQDVDLFFYCLWNDEVVILGGGGSELGMARYRAMGALYYDDPGRFARVLHERQERGLLNVGFSAGADQLGEYLLDATWSDPDHKGGFGIARGIMCTLHYEPGREQPIRDAAFRFPHCLVFGLPNDSGVAIEQGWLPSGNQWQLIHVITDNSWDLPKDGWHIKTRAGVKVQHSYCDGRHWAFGGGDWIIRVNSPDYRYVEAWILSPGGPIIDYWSQRPTGYHGIEHILATH